MAIYIKGVDIPTNCTDCRYRPLVGCNPYQDNGLSPSDHRHRTCPLTEVAEPHGHGRLIDAEDAIECVRCGWSVTDVIDRINALPSAEAVEVVRCRDCKYGEKRIEDYRCFMLDEDWDIRFSPNHFCSYGKRREDGEA